MHSDLLDSYKQESESLLSDLREQLMLPVDQWDMALVVRLVHTLKGISGTVGLKVIREVGAKLEDVLCQIADHGWAGYSADVKEYTATFVQLFCLDLTRIREDLIDLANTDNYGAIVTHLYAEMAKTLALFEDDEIIKPRRVNSKAFPDFVLEQNPKIPYELGVEVGEHLDLLLAHIRQWKGDHDDVTLIDMLEGWLFLLRPFPGNQLSEFIEEVLEWVIHGMPLIWKTDADYVQGIQDCLAELVDYNRQLLEPAPIPVITTEPALIYTGDILNIDVLDEFRAAESCFMEDWQEAWSNAVKDGGEDVKRSLHTIKGLLATIGLSALKTRVHDIESVVLAKGIYPGLSHEIPEIHRIAIQSIDDYLAYLKAVYIQSANANDQLFEVNVTGNRSSKTVDRAILATITDTYSRQGISFKKFDLSLRQMQVAQSDISQLVQRMQAKLMELFILAEQNMPSIHNTSHFSALELDQYTPVHELTRTILEMGKDLEYAQKTMGTGLRRMGMVYEEEKLQLEDLSESIQALRMDNAAVRFTKACEGIIASTLQIETTKEVQFTLDANIEIDESLVPQLTTALNHLLRNAITHGIESREERVLAGKDPAGRINGSIAQNGNEVIVTITDDGKGISPIAVKKKAVAKGLWPEDKPMSSEDACEMIFKPDFSTAETLSEVAGRGVGLDAVRDAIIQLGGRVDVMSEVGSGSQFTIVIPSTIAMVSILPLLSEDNWYGVPVNVIYSVAAYSYDQMDEHYTKGYIEIDIEKENGVKRHRFPLVAFSQLLGSKAPVWVKDRINKVVFIHELGEPLAIHVDDVVSEQKYMTQQLPSALTCYEGIISATLMADGQPLYIINPVRLQAWQRLKIQWQVYGYTAIAIRRHTPAAVAAYHRKQSLNTHAIMVVDDSMTIRAVSEAFLRKKGFEVILAKDGVDAFDIMTQQNNIPDCMLLDIEMPRMDGFELLGHMRKHPELKNIPVIMISSRTGKKHRDTATEKGANAFFGKPYREDELYETIMKLVTSTSVVGSP